jgi:hypothetical protein
LSRQWEFCLIKEDKIVGLVHFLVLTPDGSSFEPKKEPGFPGSH